MLNVYIWGDSIMKGLVFDERRRRYSLLKDSAAALCGRELEINVTSHARIGMTSEGGRERFDEQADQCAAGDIAVIFFGGNDTDYDWPAIAADPTLDHRPHVELPRFIENMTYMLAGARRRGLRPLMLTMPPIDPERYFHWVSRELEGKDQILQWLKGTPETIRQHHDMYDRAAVALAQKQQCAIVDVRAMFDGQQDGVDRLCVDGIHPNEAGQRLIAGAVLAYVREQHPQGVTETEGIQ